jgi:hypothetical protein
MTDRWEPARQRALATLQREWPHGRYGIDKDCEGAPLESHPAYVARRAVIMAPDWVPKRKGRTMPTLWKIASYWHAAGYRPMHLRVPHCFRCFASFTQDGPPPPEFEWNAAPLERAHLVDRIRGGLDGAQNLMPLCHRCHKIMPSFDPGEGPDAIAWVKRGGRRRLRIVHDGDPRKFAHLVAESFVRRQIVGD